MADDINMNEAFEYVFGQPEQIADGIQVYNLPTPPHVCAWCVKHAYDLSNGQLDYDECFRGMIDKVFLFELNSGRPECADTIITQPWSDQHDCLARIYDWHGEIAWAESCDCWCNKE